MPEDLPGYSDNSELFRGLFTSFGDKPSGGISAWGRKDFLCGCFRRFVQRSMPDPRISLSFRGLVAGGESGASDGDCFRVGTRFVQTVRDLPAAQCGIGWGDVRSWQNGAPSFTALCRRRVDSVCHNLRKWCREKPVHTGEAVLRWEKCRDDRPAGYRKHPP